jgi:hypothetical protein
MAAVRVPESPTSNRSAGEAHRLGQRRELVQAGVLDTALAEVGHVGPPGDDAPRGPLELDAAPPAPVLATKSIQETLELPGDVGQVPIFHFLYARMINDTTMRRPSTRCRRSADGRVLGMLACRTSSFTHSRKFVCKILEREPSELRPDLVRCNSAGSSPAREENYCDGAALPEIHVPGERIYVLRAEPALVPSCA